MDAMEVSYVKIFRDSGGTIVHSKCANELFKKVTNMNTTVATGNEDGFPINVEAIMQAAKTLQEQCHWAAFYAGWWNDVLTNKPVTDNPLCFSNKLMLIVSEVSESMEGDRKDLMDDKLPHRQMREVELADAVIRIFDLAGAYRFDLAGAIAEKMLFNAQRPDHKLSNRLLDGGKKF
jgi:NTP pyrophosphatase (non-canonical NTP hydrolase)